MLYVVPELSINIPLILQLLFELIRHIRLLLSIQAFGPLLQLLQILLGHSELALALNHLILEYLRPFSHLLDLNSLPINFLLQCVVFLRPLFEHPCDLFELLLHVRELILDFFDALLMEHLQVPLTLLGKVAPVFSLP